LPCWHEGQRQRTPSCWCCATRSRCCDARCPGRRSTGPTGRCWLGWRGCCRARPGGACSSSRPRCCAGIATWSGAAGATRTGVAGRPWRRRSARWCCGWPGRTRPGVSPHPRRAVPPRLPGQDRSQHGVDDPAACRRCSGAGAVGAHLAAVPPGSGCQCAGGGLLHRGDGLAAAAVRPVCDRGRDPPGPCARGDVTSSRGVGDTAGPQSAHGP
jgi:hypothetical protein